MKIISVPGKARSWSLGGKDTLSGTRGIAVAPGGDIWVGRWSEGITNKVGKIYHLDPDGRERIQDTITLPYPDYFSDTTGVSAPRIENIVIRGTEIWASEASLGVIYLYDTAESTNDRVASVIFAPIPVEHRSRHQFRGLVHHKRSDYIWFTDSGYQSLNAIRSGAGKNGLAFDPGKIIIDAGIPPDVAAFGSTLLIDEDDEALWTLVMDTRTPANNVVVKISLKDVDNPALTGLWPVASAAGLALGGGRLYIGTGQGDVWKMDPVAGTSPEHLVSIDGAPSLDDLLLDKAGYLWAGNTQASPSGMLFEIIPSRAQVLACYLLEAGPDGTTSPGTIAWRGDDDTLLICDTGHNNRVLAVNPVDSITAQGISSLTLTASPDRGRTTPLTPFTPPFRVYALNTQEQKVETVLFLDILPAE
jgi:hypothetical protein